MNYPDLRPSSMGTQMRSVLKHWLCGPSYHPTDVRRNWRTLWRDTGAVTAVEFSLIGPIFLLLMFLIMDVGFSMFQQAELDNVTRLAARGIMTGSDTSQADFVANLKNALMPATGVTYSVQSVSSVGGATPQFSSLVPAKVSATGTFGDTWNPGGSDDAVLVQVAYARPWLSGMLASYSGVLVPTITSTLAFIAEPY